MVGTKPQIERQHEIGKYHRRDTDKTLEDGKQVNNGKLLDHLNKAETTEGNDEPEVSGFMVQNSKMAQVLAMPETYDDKSET